MCLAQNQVYGRCRCEIALDPASLPDRVRQLHILFRRFGGARKMDSLLQYVLHGINEAFRHS